MRSLARLVAGAAVLILLSGLFGCSDDDSSTGGANVPPIITSLTATPSSFRSGEVCTLRVVASDPDGDALSYYWGHSGGQEKLAWVSAAGSNAVLGTCGCPVAENINAWAIAIVDDGRGGEVRDSTAIVLMPAE